MSKPANPPRGPFLPKDVLRWDASGRAPAGVAAYEHPFLIRFCHWLNTVSLFVMIGSGLQIFMAFPSFGAKIPQKVFVIIPSGLRLGGWLGGALQWHLTFASLYIATGLIYVGYQLFSGNFRQVLLTRKEANGVWSMFRFYFLRGPKPEVDEVYNPLQKLAYMGAILLGVLSVWTGLAIYKPTQLSFLTWTLGGFRLARVWHFTVLWLFVAFIAGHVVMVILHGWKNFVSMLTGWKRNPEYLR